MWWAIFFLVSLLPAIAAAVIGATLHFILRAKAPAFQFGIWSFALAAGGYAAWQGWLFARDARDTPAYVTGSVVLIALPLFAAAVGLFAFFFGWGGAAIVIEWRRVSAGTSGAVAAVARAFVPATFMLLAAAYLWFLERPGSYERAQAAKDNPAAIAALFREGIERNDEDLLQDVGSLPTLTPEMVAALATHPNAFVRWKAATRADLTPEQMLRLAADPDDDVRGRVALNEAVTDDALRVVIAAGGSQPIRDAQSALDRRAASTRPAS